MKKYFLLSLVTLVFITYADAQSVGINNDGSSPNPSAMLDINSPVKGVLISRVALTGTDDITTITSPATSLLVYNTATVPGANAVTPGFYYWGGSSWLVLSTGMPGLKKDIVDSIANTGYATVYSRNKARDSVQANLDGVAANLSVKKDNVDSISNTGYATVYSRNKARDSVQTNIAANNAGILLKKDNIDSIASTGYATVFSRDKARDSVQANITAISISKKDNIDSIASTGYATVFSRDKARDSVQANIDINTAAVLLKKDDSDSTNPISGYTTLYQNSLKEAPLSFAAGLTRTGNDVNNNVATGIAGFQTIVGSTSDDAGMIYKATTGAGNLGSDHIFQVGNNGAIEAMRIVSNPSYPGYIGIGTTFPTTVLHVFKDLPPGPGGTGNNTVIKIQNGYGAGNFGLNQYGAYWQNSAVVSPYGGGFNIYNLGGSGFFGIQTNGNVGIGTVGPQAFLEVKPGNTGHVPFRLNSGALASSRLSGGIEFLNDAFYGTITTGNTRKTFAFLESPTFTGTVGGITAAMVGLDNVDNTSDVNKPLSTAAQTALNLKWDAQGNTGVGTSGFIGTTDNTPFNVKVNNQNSGRIDNILLNTFWGYQAGNINSTGTSNTAIGANSLSSNLSGNSNTAIGNGANVSVDGLTNATAIGNTAVVDASDKVRIGNASVTVIEGQVAYSFPSDARFKYNIQNNVPGLDFIKKLTPVTYYFDEDKLMAYTLTGNLNNGIGTKAAYTSRELHTGFLAQDVEKIANQLGYHFDGIHVPTNNRDHYSLAYTQFIMPLVKSVQEQQQIIETQTKTIDAQEMELQKLNDKIEALSKAVEKLAGR